MKLSVLKAERIIAEHKLRLAELAKLIRSGDWVEVEKKVKIISKQNCQMAFRRVHSKNHHLVVKALEEVISERLAKFEK